MELIKVYKIRPFQPVDEMDGQVGAGNPGLLVAMGRQHGAISYAKMCELSELSELSVLLLRFRRVEVCALSALCAISPPFELEGMGRRLLWGDEWWSPPAAGPVSGHLWCQVVKDLYIVRGRLGALLLSTRSLCSLCGLRAGRRNTDQKAWY